jgi:uncharacterized membrane protein YkoI
VLNARRAGVRSLLLESTGGLLMRTRFTWVLGAAAMALLFVAIGARADEEKVPLDKLPKAVVDAVKARFPGAKLVSAEKEKDDGKTVFEVAIKDKDQSIEVTLTPEGKITEIEKQIEAKSLPEAVAKALEEKYAKATYKMIEEVYKVDKEEKLEYYEVLLVTAAKKKLEVSVAPDGKIVKEEDKSKEKD